ncbi:Thymidylate kinase [Smittium culicis]|uniref:Thymidylate kinase n=1 Tax=Smittium culicis TaxID=133412 RepID=A0A1R1YNZ2_9FUNG|nr:Thymidylate kinase [Smittium culicis]
MGWCLGPDKGLVKPDVTFFMDINPSDAKNRGNYGEERYEVENFQQQVIKQFKKLAEPNWNIIDAGQPLNSVTQQVQSIAVNAIDENKSSINEFETI